MHTKEHFKHSEMENIKWFGFIFKMPLASSIGSDTYNFIHLSKGNMFLDIVS